MEMTTTTLALLRTLFWFRVSIGALGAEVWITSVNEFIRFKNNVDKGTSYSGTTVFLDSDLDLTGKTFEPIGNYSNYFLGVFDGQGHLISNLKMSSSYYYVGLFGYSMGLTIKNIILDSSCSIASSYSDSSDTYVGGIIGYCYADNGKCTIENSVNMGSVTFSGNISSSLYLGGIVGFLSSSYNHDCTVKNFANYGDVAHSGTSSYSYIGGIAGQSGGSSSNKVYIYNCLNYGTITHKGTTSYYLYLGGIVGWTYYTTIENCVSDGKISSTKLRYSYVGSIVGGVSYGISINYCYYTNDLNSYGKYGDGTPPNESNTLSYNLTTFELNETVSVGNYRGSSLIDALNAYADNYTFLDYSHWLLNKEKKAVSFTINDISSFILSYQIILLPSLASEGKLCFDGWYEDNGLTTQLTSYEVKSETDLYGKYCTVVIVTLDVNGGDELTTKKMTIGCDKVYGDLPTPIRTEATFLGWFTGKKGGELVTSNMTVKTTQDHTIYAHWEVNSYTLTFILGNGTEPEVRSLNFNETITYPTDPVKEGYSFAGWSPKPERMPANNINIIAQWTANNYIVAFNTSGGNISYPTKTVIFDSPYGELPIPNKRGFTFSGWFNEMNESVTNESIVKTPNNHTLHTHWTEVPANQVEIIFNSKSLTTEEIEEVINQFTDADFEIVLIEHGEEETRVIIKFIDEKIAEKFVRGVNEAHERGGSEKTSYIRRVDFVRSSLDVSLSFSCYPMALFFI